MSYLIDTNIISELARPKPNHKVLKWLENTSDESLYLSVITLGEIRQGVEKLVDEVRKEKLRLWLENEIPEWFKERILPIDTEVADRWGRLRAQMKRTLPAVDSLLAATALHYDLRVVTRNTSDFDYPTLEIINPWSV